MIRLVSLNANAVVIQGLSNLSICGTAVEHAPHDQEVMGSKPAASVVYFLSFLRFAAFLQKYSVLYQVTQRSNIYACGCRAGPRSGARSGSGNWIHQPLSRFMNIAFRIQTFIAIQIDR